VKPHLIKQELVVRSGEPLRWQRWYRAVCDECLCPVDYCREAPDDAVPVEFFVKDPEPGPRGTTALDPEAETWYCSDACADAAAVKRTMEVLRK
jgi:hypothetical protein